MDVALDGDEFFLVISVRERGSLCRLDAVPFAIDLCERMNIVRERVVIGKANGLADAHRQNMRGVAATVLVKVRFAHSFRGCVIRAGGDVHDDISESVAWAGDHFFGQQRLGVQFHARGVLGHVDGSAFAGVPT